jgi:4-amino-4-deoxy-L-arabinose transferase-like glycosyltransferase
MTLTESTSELSPRTRTLTRGFFALIVLGYLIVGALFAIRTPDWQSPDEPAHYNYVAQVAANGCCPLIAQGDWDSPYLETLKSARFAPKLLDEIDTIQYEDHQPPLYYLLLSPVYRLTNGSLTGLRLTSVLIGTLIVISAYAIGREIYPQQPQIALGAAAFVAFQPQHIAILASVNNDALGWALVGLILWALVVYLRQPLNGIRIEAWMIGLLIGVALITKATAYFMVGIALIAIGLRVWTDRRAYHTSLGISPEVPFTFNEPLWLRFAKYAAELIVPALCLGFVWWFRNFAVYGLPDFLGLRAHDAVVVGQLRTAAEIGSIGIAGYLENFARITFYSFWGMFGWQGLPLVGNSTVDWVYPLIGVLLLVAGSGILIRLIRYFRQPRDTSGTFLRSVWLLMIALMILAVLQYFYYNTEFVQFQGRYMFPLLIPLGLLIALGLDVWRLLLLGRSDASRWLVPLMLCGFALLDVYLLWRVIVPGLSIPV